MDAKRATFPKSERLAWKRHIDRLFAEGKSFVSFPLRVVYLPVKTESVAAAISVLVSVPKKKLRHAVDRNFVKRRIRESYRLRKQAVFRSFAGRDEMLLLAFLYLDAQKDAFAVIDAAMEKALATLQTTLHLQD
ncbi:MAG: ribonuclease P protein component [Tannerella sp.]|jgi:ribonuclease P protein component|nr:ribonuclease P protein component [Tannerella sp.]